MTPLELSAGISILASAIAEPLSDEALALASALFVQIGDTLATIAVQRSFSASPVNPSANQSKAGE